jgi:NitT/TauT family transport system substrate-binding protein
MGLATELVDESTRWPGGRFPTTELVVSNSYMQAHPDVVRKLVQANLDAIQFIEGNTDQAKHLANRELEDLGGGALPAGALDQAWSRLTFSYDPLPKEMEQYALNAYNLGIFDTRPDNLATIFSLATLNSILRQEGLSPVGVN